MSKKPPIESHYIENAPRIRGRFRTLGIASHEDAEDLAHDVYVHALSTKKIKLKTLPQLMNTIVKNLFVDSARKFNRRGQFHLDVDTEEIRQVPDHAIPVEHQVILRQTKKTVWEAVGKVSKPNYRKILELVAQGYSPKEIAQMLDMNRGTVRTDIRRALQELREKFDDEQS